MEDGEDIAGKITHLTVIILGVCGVSDYFILYTL